MAEWLRRRPAKPMGSARVGSNPIGVAVALHAGADIFAPNHDHRTTNLHCDGSPLQLPTVTVAILAQGTSWADAATQAYFDALPPAYISQYVRKNKTET